MRETWLPGLDAIGPSIPVEISAVLNVLTNLWRREPLYQQDTKSDWYTVKAAMQSSHVKLCWWPLVLDYLVHRSVDTTRSNLRDQLVQYRHLYGCARLSFNTISLMPQSRCKTHCLISNTLLTSILENCSSRSTVCLFISCYVSSKQTLHIE